MATNKLKIGSKIPSFDLPAVDGSNYSLDSFKDKKLLMIVFSCNHCPYVQAYEDRMIRIQKEYADNLRVAAINSNDAVKYPEDSFDEMKKRSADRNFNFPYLYDESQDLAKAFDASHTPEIFLFNENRELIFHGKIDDNWQDESGVKSKYLKSAIDEYLSGKPISIPETFTIGCTIKWK